MVEVKEEISRGEKRNLEEEGKKEEIKEIKEDEKKTKRGDKRGMKSEEEERTRKLEDAVEEVEEEVHFDAVEEERKRERAEPKIEASKPAGVKRGGRNGTKIVSTSCVNGSNGDSKDPVRHSRINEMPRRKRIRRGLSHGAQRELHSWTGTSLGKGDCGVGQTVTLGGEGGTRHYSQQTIKDTVFNLLSRMYSIVLILISTGLWGLMKATPVIMDKDSRPSKYTAQGLTAGYQVKSSYCKYLKPVMKPQRRERWLCCAKHTC